MKHTIIKASQLSSEFALHEIQTIETIQARGISMLRSGDLEVVAILIDDELDEVSLGLYVDLAKALGKAGAIIEVCMRNHVTLPTVDAFSMPFVDALKISQSTRISFDISRKKDWRPANPVSSVIVMLPCDINYLSAEEIVGYYMDSAMVFDICVTLSGAFEEDSCRSGYVDLGATDQSSPFCSERAPGAVDVGRERDVA